MYSQIVELVLRDIKYENSKKNVPHNTETTDCLLQTRKVM